MSDFDPYYKWLGISPRHQPPNHYRLLAIELYESDPDVIEASVGRIAAFLQDVATGPQARESQKLLNEIAAARLCLLDASRKSAYDEKLGAERAQAMWPPGDESQPAPPPPVVPTFAIDTSASSIAKPTAVRQPTTKRPAVTAASNRTPSSPPGKTNKRGRQKASPLLLLSFVSGGVLIIAAAIASLSGNSEAKRRAAEEAKVRERLESFANVAREAESMIPDFQPQFDFSPPPARKSNQNKNKRRNKK